MKTSSRYNRRGSTVLVVLVLMALLIVVLSTNNVAMRQLDHGLRAVEKKQLARYGVSNHQTNAPPR